MDLEALGNAGELISAIAVIFSILYLARQINQSTLLAKAENQRELLNTAHLWHPLATTPGLTADFRNGVNHYTDMDPDAQARFHHIMHPLLNHVEAVFRMHRQGLLEDDSYERWMAGIVAIITTPGGAAWWQHIKGMLGREFVASLEQMRDNSDETYDFSSVWHFYRDLPVPLVPRRQQSTDQRISTGRFASIMRTSRTHKVMAVGMTTVAMATIRVD